MATISLVNDLKALIDFALFYNEDNHPLSISHEVEPSEGDIDDPSSSLVLSLPTMCSGKTCEDSVVSLKLVTTKRKKVTTIVEVSKRVTKGNKTFDNAHVTHVTLVTPTTLTRKVSQP